MAVAAVQCRLNFAKKAGSEPANAQSHCSAAMHHGGGVCGTVRRLRPTERSGVC